MKLIAAGTSQLHWIIAALMWLTRAWRRLFLLCACANNGHEQTTSLDRDFKATPGREVRVGLYACMRFDCTAGPLPAIRLFVPP